MNKFKNWLRIKLKKFLDIDDIESNFKDHEIFNNIRFSDVEKDINDRVSYLRKLINNSTNDISHLNDSINVLHNTIENVVHIGTDVRTVPNNYSHSWAVICIEGKINIVKFIDLNGKDCRDIIYYLKQYEGGKHCIDIPYQEMFYNELFKF